MSMKREISVQLLSVNRSEKSDDKVKINIEGGIDKDHFLEKDLDKVSNDISEAFRIVGRIFEDCNVQHIPKEEKLDYYQYAFINLRRVLRKTEDKLPGITNILILACFSSIPRVCQALKKRPLPNIENTNAKISVLLSYVPSFITSNLSLDYLINCLIQPNPLPVILPKDSLDLLRSTYNNMPKQPVFDLLQSLDYNFDILLNIFSNIFSKDSNEQPKIVLSEFIKNFLKKIDEFNNNKTHILEIGTPQKNETKEEIEKLRVEKTQKEINATQEDLKDMQDSINLLLEKRNIKKYEVSLLKQKIQERHAYARIKIYDGYYPRGGMANLFEDENSIQERILKLDIEITHMKKNIEDMKTNFEEIKKETDQLLLAIKEPEIKQQSIQEDNREIKSNDIMRVEPQSIQEVDWKNITKVLIANDYINIETGTFNKNCPKLKIKLHNVKLTPEAGVLIGVLKEKGYVDFDVDSREIIAQLNIPPINIVPVTEVPVPATVPFVNTQATVYLVNAITAATVPLPVLKCSTADQYLRNVA